MPANPDFKELFSTFNEEQVEYLVAGAHAVIFHAEPRFTKDLDIWVNPTPENAQRVWKALKRFGAPLTGIQWSDFCNTDLVYQIGLAPNRIDVIMGLSGVDFPSAWTDRVTSSYEGTPIWIMGKKSLILAKQAAGRPQDLLDLERLRSSTN